MITARFDAIVPSSRRVLVHIARQVGRTEGLIDVGWFESGLTISLLVSFEDAETSTRFLDSAAMQGFINLDGCLDVYIEVLPMSDSLTSTSLNAMAQRLQTSALPNRLEPLPISSRS